MKNRNHLSLIKESEIQPELIPSDQMNDDIFRESEQEKHEFTGKRLFKNDPERYQTIISLLAENLPIIRISRMLNVSPYTVRGVREREVEIVAQVKKRLLAAFRNGAEMCLEGLLEDLDDEIKRKKINPRDKSIIIGVLTDKFQLLSGGATSRIEFVTPKPEHKDFNDYLDGLKQAEAEIGMRGEKQKTKEPIALLPERAESLKGIPQ